MTERMDGMGWASASLNATMFSTQRHYHITIDSAWNSLFSQDQGSETNVLFRCAKKRGVPEAESSLSQEEKSMHLSAGASRLRSHLRLRMIELQRLPPSVFDRPSDLNKEQTTSEYSRCAHARSCEFPDSWLLPSAHSHVEYQRSPVSQSQRQ
jgi:hypothetical protein